LDLNAAVDGRAWGGSQNNALYIDLLGTFGGSISNQVVDLQGLDNIEAYNTFKLYAAWYEHTFGGSGFSVRLGLQDYNVLFDTLDSAALFINSSFGLDATIAQSNVSQYPVTAAGAVIRWESPRGAYAMGGVYDGVPGLRGHPAGTHIEFQPGDGVFSGLEVGLVGDGAEPYKLAVGGWYQTSNYVDLAGRGRDRNHGLYALGETRLLGGETLPAVDAFVQLGYAEPDRNTLNRYIGVGVDVTGLVPGRPHDTLGLGMARAHTSTTYQHIAPVFTEAEIALELTYRAVVTTRISLQPDVQYIRDPGADRRIGDAWVVGIRGQFIW
jgi:porin